MSEQVQLTEAERDALTRALGSGSGCWDFEECCWSSFEAMLPAVEAIVAGRLARVEALAEIPHPHVEAVRAYLDNAGITPETLRYAATHEALCRSWIFDLLTGLADILSAPTPAAPCRECGPGYRIGDEGCRHAEGDA